MTKNAKHRLLVRLITTDIKDLLNTSNYQILPLTQLTFDDQ